jgi:hypothetical protein
MTLSAKTTLSMAHRARLVWVAALLGATALVGGCGDRSRHASDGDTGAAAPATKLDLTRTSRAADSTPATANPAGAPNTTSVDTAGARARDSVRGRSARKPARP